FICFVLYSFRFVFVFVLWWRRVVRCGGGCGCRRRRGPRPDGTCSPPATAGWPRRGGRPGGWRCPPSPCRPTHTPRGESTTLYAAHAHAHKHITSVSLHIDI